MTAYFKTSKYVLMCWNNNGASHSGSPAHPRETGTRSPPQLDSPAVVSCGHTPERAGLGREILVPCDEKVKVQIEAQQRNGVKYKGGIAMYRDVRITAHVEVGNTTTTERVLYNTGTSHKISDCYSCSPAPGGMGAGPGWRIPVPIVHAKMPATRCWRAPWKVSWKCSPSASVSAAPAGSPPPARLRIQRGRPAQLS